MSSSCEHHVFPSTAALIEIVLHTRAYIALVQPLKSNCVQLYVQVYTVPCINMSIKEPLAIRLWLWLAIATGRPTANSHLLPSTCRDAQKVLPTQYTLLLITAVVLLSRPEQLMHTNGMFRGWYS